MYVCIYIYIYIYIYYIYIYWRDDSSCMASTTADHSISKISYFFAVRMLRSLSYFFARIQSCDHFLL